MYPLRSELRARLPRIIETEQRHPCGRATEARTGGGAGKPSRTFGAGRLALFKA